MSCGKSALVGLAFVVLFAAGALVLSLRSGDPWPLVYVKEGGFAGFAQELTLQENGDAILTDLRSQETERFTVDGDDMNRIEKALDKVDWASAEGNRSVEGADVLYLSIQFGGHSSRGALMTPEEDTLLPVVGLLDVVIAKSRV